MTVNLPLKQQYTKVNMTQATQYMKPNILLKTLHILKNIQNIRLKRFVSNICHN